MKTVYISIGNSDDKLTQYEWSKFWYGTDLAVSAFAKEVHGAWLSAPNDRYQNACWCVTIADDDAERLVARLGDFARRFRQDAVAWAEVAEMKFLSGKGQE